jgi:predicted dehydrogenase
MKIGIGFAGLGHVHIESRTEAALADEQVDVLGAYDEDQEILKRFTDGYGIPPRPLKELLQDDRISLIYVVCPTYKMPPLVLSALEYKKHVLVEKPGAPNRREMDRILKAAEDSSRNVRVGYTWEFLPIFPQLQEIFASGMMGRIVQGRIHMGYPEGALLNDFFCWPHSPGGVFYETVCHSLNLLLLFQGRPEGVSARIEKYDLGKHPFEDVGAAILEYGDRMVTIDLCGWEANDFGVNHRMEYYGTKGTLFVSFKPPRFELYLKEGSGSFASGWTTYESEASSTGYQQDLAKAVDGIREGHPQKEALNRARDVISVLEAAYRSAQKEGSAVKIDY